MINFKFGNFGLLIGPSLNFNLNSEYEIVNTTGYSQNVTMDDAGGFELGAVLGFDYMITPNIGIDARVHGGLTEVSEDSKAHNLQIMGGIKVLF